MDSFGFRDPGGDWCKEEFSCIHLGDNRLNERFVKTAERILACPESSVNQACISWAETKAAYRLFDNEKVNPEEFILSHQESVRKRMVGLKIVLAIQDTVYFNFDSRFDGYAVESTKKFMDMHGIVMLVPFIG